LVSLTPENHKTKIGNESYNSVSPSELNWTRVDWIERDENSVLDIFQTVKEDGRKKHDKDIVPLEFSGQFCLRGSALRRAQMPGLPYHDALGAKQASFLKSLRSGVLLQQYGKQLRQLFLNTVDSSFSTIDKQRWASSLYSRYVFSSCKRLILSTITSSLLTRDASPGANSICRKLEAPEQANVSIADDWN
ncbi:hypothetical protein STEG23_024613, partial [Scotinomys teguina]